MMRSVLSIKEQNKSHWERRKFSKENHTFSLKSFFLRWINKFFHDTPKWSILKANNAYFTEKIFTSKISFAKTNKQTNKRIKNDFTHKEIQSLIDVWCVGFLLWFFHEKIIQLISFRSFHHSKTNKFTNKPFWYSYFLFKQKCFLFCMCEGKRI